MDKPFSYFNGKLLGGSSKSLEHKLESNQMNKQITLTTTIMVVIILSKDNSGNDNYNK